MSFRMPSIDTLPSIQCHHTRGLASCGGFLNPSYTVPCARTPCAKVSDRSAIITFFILAKIIFSLKNRRNTVTLCPVFK